MNVLLTSAGRRVSLLKAFKDVTHQQNGRVFAGDVDSLAPTLYFADQSLRLPRIDDSAYIPSLKEIVENHHIKLIVPTIDSDLLILAREASDFRRIGCEVLVSSYDLINSCQDKWEFVRLFEKNGFLVPRSWLPKEIAKAQTQTSLPTNLFIKPRGGSASKDSYRVHRDDLSTLLPQVPNPIVQKEIKAPEITIDALLDFEGKPIHFVPRFRIRTLAGESIQGSTFADADLADWILRLLEAVATLGGKGPITIQAFLTNGQPTLSEINPRFGGGFPLTLAAGGDYPEWIMQMVAGKTVKPKIGNYTKNLYMTRYHEEIFLEKPKWD